MDLKTCSKLPMCIFRRNTWRQVYVCYLPSMQRWLGKRWQGNTGDSIIRVQSTPTATYLWINKKIKGISTISGREHLQAPTTTHGSINWHMLHSRHPSTTLIHQVHPRPGSIQLLQLMMVSAMQRQDYHIPATHTSQRWTYLLIAARGSVLWESQGFFPRRNKHRAASRWCCHLGKLLLEKQEKCVGWAEKTM